MRYLLILLFWLGLGTFAYADTAAEDAAYADAVKLVNKTMAAGELKIDLSIDNEDFDFGNLKRIPPEIKNFTGYSLYIDQTLITDLSPLKNLPVLSNLSAMQTKISDLTVLASLPELETLYLNRTQVSDLSPLSTLEHLGILELSHTQVTDLQPLSQLTSLTSLNLNHTAVSDISPLANQVELTALDLGHTKVSDISALPNSTRLLHIFPTVSKAVELVVAVNCRL